MYTVFTKLGDNEFLYIASHDKFEQAIQLAEKLNAGWPRKYVVRDSISNEIRWATKEEPAATRRPVTPPTEPPYIA
jgi:hypothetical protein